MQITIRGKNLPITEALRAYIEKRLNKLDRFLGAGATAQVSLSIEKERHIVEVTIAIDGYLLRGEEEAGDMYSSVDLVVEKLEKQIGKYKTKLAKKIKSRNFKEWVTAQPGEENQDLEPRIVRVKRFPLKPMSLEEAILQMNLLGHSFFIFTNAETEEVNLIYRRKDGNYGLIEPEA
ncbi:MAG: putative sigma-54 modulation protein [Clostridia bacterium]|nr:putative sigma-54 modulation protein [Clostridia bacterium]